MERYITADAAKKVINGIDSSFARFIDDIPAADVRENVKGEWMYEGLTTSIDRGYRCSNCNFTTDDFFMGLAYNFCPNCGADMRGEKDG